MHDAQNDPRTRRGRHELTAANLSSTIRFTNIPAHWTKEMFCSVITGSGSIVDVNAKRQNSASDQLECVEVDYKNAVNASHAAASLSKVKNFPCRMEPVIPDDWEEKLSGSKDAAELEFSRDDFPWDDRLELPFEMVSEVPLPRRPAPGATDTASDAASAAAHTASTNAASDTLASSANETPVQKMQIPDILARASKHLPAYQPGSMSNSDAVSRNLSKIPTLQMIEILSNLKILADQHNKIPQLEQFLKTNIDLTVAVTQAMLEMGLINYHVISKVLDSIHGAAQAPQPAQPMPAVQTPQPPQPAPAMPAASVAGPRFNESKLAQLPQDQQNMIRSALSMSPSSISALSADQQQLIQQLKNDYLL